MSQVVSGEVKVISQYSEYTKGVFGLNLLLLKTENTVTK